MQQKLHFIDRMFLRTRTWHRQTCHDEYTEIGKNANHHRAGAPEQELEVRPLVGKVPFKVALVAINKVPHWFKEK